MLRKRSIDGLEEDFVQMQEPSDHSLAGAIDIGKFAVPASHPGTDTIIIPGRRRLSSPAASLGIVAHAFLQILFSNTAQLCFARQAWNRQETWAEPQCILSFVFLS
jgi:hypothetical protein